MTSSTADTPPNATPLAIETDSTIEMQSFNGHLSGDNTTANARSHHTLTHSHTHDTETETEIENQVGKSSIVKNQSHSLKRSILNKFMPMTFSILIFVSGCSVGFLYMSNQFVLDETHDMLMEQYSRYGGHIAEGESAAISSVLSWTGLEAEAAMLSDFYRTNHSIGNNNMSYLGFDDLIARPVDRESAKHFGRPISLSHSSYIFPNMSREDLIHRLSPAQQRNRDLVSNIDYIAKRIYEVRDDHFQSFFAMEEDGMFVAYPGQRLFNNGSTLVPDWRNREWYIKAKALQHETIITEPYMDALSGESVISLCRAVHNVETGEFKGVVGIDFLITQLQKYILPVFDLEREIVFFGTTGRILLDSAWYLNASTEVSYILDYSTLVDPTITESEWNQIQSTRPGYNKDISLSNSYHCYAFRFNQPQHEFVFISLANEDRMLEKANRLASVMLEDWQVSLVLVLLVTCILIATTLSVFYITVATLARDVDRTYKQINNLFHKLRVTAEENKENGQDAETLAKSIDALEMMGHSDPALLSQLGSSPKKVVRGLRKRSKQSMSKLFSPTDAINANPFWNKKHPFLHHYEVSEKFLTRPPDTPPPSGHFDGHGNPRSSRRYSREMLKKTNSGSIDLSSVDAEPNSSVVKYVDRDSDEDLDDDDDDDGYSDGDDSSEYTVDEDDDVAYGHVENVRHSVVNTNRIDEEGESSLSGAGSSVHSLDISHDDLDLDTALKFTDFIQDKLDATDDMSDVAMENSIPDDQTKS